LGPKQFTPGGRIRQDTYLSFNLFLMKQTGAAVSSAFSALSKHKDTWPFNWRKMRKLVAAGRLFRVFNVNWFSNHPLWLPVLWQHAGAAPATNTQEFGSCAAAWKEHRSHAFELLQGTTDWLKAVSSDPSKLAAAALSAIGAADSNRPLFCTEVDVRCLQISITDRVLALQHAI
jgi:hypothetical protein